MLAFGSLDLKSLGLAGLGATSLAVIVTLVALSIWSLAVSAERLIAFARARRQSLAFVRALSARAQQDWLRDALELAGRYPQSHLARVVAAGLATFQRKRSRGTLREEELLAAAERALELSALRTAADLRRGVGSLATIATTAPFIGLFGTVIGIMHAFESIGRQGGAGFAIVSQGISEALATTALGLLVAIPAAWMFNSLSQRIERLRLEMEGSSCELLDFFRDVTSGAIEA